MGADLIQLSLFVLEGKASLISQLYTPPYKIISYSIFDNLAVEILFGITFLAYLINLIIKKRSNDLEALFIFLSNIGVLMILLPIALSGDARIGPPLPMFAH